MRARALVHIVGPDGAGKTTFVEALLQARPGMIVICVRAQRDSRLRKEAESAPRSHPELRRYRAAGAGAVALYRFPAPHSDAFFMSDVMQDYSEVVLIEGDCPLDYVDLSIYVAPPLPRGTPLLRRVTRDHADPRRAALRAYEQAIDSPAAMARLLGAVGEPLIALALRRPGLLEDIKRGLTETAAVARHEPPPAPTEHWALREGYEGIERAQLVVANVRRGGDLQAARALIEDVKRLRQDPNVFQDVIGRRGSKIPVTAVFGDASDRSDPGMKKAFARVTRAIGQLS